ncbi:ATP-binding cassette sub-family G member 5 [Ischnura elegans]|uniref:ATP-binding cassette sub-family G member 5 n=1 Tax=Ischnura elegans TaxID=197161 RepID=UPI001ED88099|nr:ATP-binding cassette sub-family G member 5 [Ischnura elegans]
MISRDTPILELNNVFHSGQVESGTWLQRIMGSVKTGLILKDISLEIHRGEVLAILGSKGSGKRALLDVISRRTEGGDMSEATTRGQIHLGGSVLTRKLFQERCAYVTRRCDLLPGLNVRQTLEYAASLTIGSKEASGQGRSSRVRQVMADLALTQSANRSVNDITRCERRRLEIGVQLVKDPVLLLLDEPTRDLDPLGAYLVSSMVSADARRNGRAVALTAETPRSDVFPFLHRVALLCLGDLLYAGPVSSATISGSPNADSQMRRHHLLTYFADIGFPCPRMENPLMYYLCLSTVDRRSRERFLESNHQIAALVDKFKAEGAPYRKAFGFDTDETLAGGPMGMGVPPPPLPPPFSQPGTVRVAKALVSRQISSILNFRLSGLGQLCLRVLSLPLFFLLLWLFYSGREAYQRTYVSTNGLIFNFLAGCYFISIFSTVCTFPVYRTRYFQECQEGLYGGWLFHLAYSVGSLPFTIVATLASSRIAVEVSGLTSYESWLYLWGIFFACHVVAEQQTLAFMRVQHCSLSAASNSLLTSSIYLILGSGTLRSLKALPEWLFYLTYATQPRYAGSLLAGQLFSVNPHAIPNCTAVPPLLPPGPTYSNIGVSQREPIHQALVISCGYDGLSYLTERYGDSVAASPPSFDLGISMAFAAGVTVFVGILFLLPLPAVVKSKFRE